MISAPASPASLRPSDSPSEDSARKLLAEYRPGWSLPQRFYTDPEIFARDVERIFMREWLLIDHASRIPRPGDYFLFEIAGESIIVVRGKDGQVNAFFNVCRHRGSRVCIEPSGSAPALVCPYHAWSYGLDGKLLSARAMPKDFAPADHALRRCGVRLVEDLIFICLAENPPPIEPQFQTWERFIRPHGLTRAKIAHRVVWKVKANWKLLVENFLECYHCGPAHPEYCSVMLHTRPASGLARDAEIYNALARDWAERAKAQGTFIARTTLDSEPYCMSDRVPIKENFLTQSRQGRPVAPLMGDFAAYDGGVTAGELEPLNFYIAPNDYFLVPRFTPLTVDTSEMEMIWLVRADAVEGRDYRLEALIWLWKVTTDEDKTLIEENQAGINSRSYQPGRLAEVERSLMRFITHYTQAIA